jgi:phage tail protein X
MTTTEYITKPGDRWDLIAYKAFGTVNDIVMDDGTRQNAVSVVVHANPGIAVDSVLDPGLLLQIPVIPDSTIQTDEELLPPWKR